MAFLTDHTIATHSGSNSIKQILSTAGIALVFFFTSVVAAQDNSSGVSMKMSEQLNQVVERGVTKMHQIQQQQEQQATSTQLLTPGPGSAPAAKPIVTKLKMEKMNSRFVEKQGEIVDRIYHLTWARCSLGQRWVKDQGCVGKVRQYTFDQALNLSTEQWRIPTGAELATLIDRTKRNQPEMLATDTIAFPDMDPKKLFYWSSDEENNSFAWAVLFIDGGVPGILYRSHRYAIRLVRNAAP